MRTTLNIDGDVLSAVKELAKREQTTTGEFVSNLLREALRAGWFRRSQAFTARRLRLQAHPVGG